MTKFVRSPPSHSGPLRIQRRPRGRAHLQDPRLRKPRTHKPAQLKFRSPMARSRLKSRLRHPAAASAADTMADSDTASPITDLISRCRRSATLRTAHLSGPAPTQRVNRTVLVSSFIVTGAIVSAGSVATVYGGRERRNVTRRTNQNGRFNGGARLLNGTIISIQ
jgi:hypothetical protein